jgi:hypothetical protein
MSELDVVQTVAGGGGTAVWGMIAIVLWRIHSEIKRMASLSADALSHARSTAQRAERHYDTEEELYRGVREAAVRHDATIEARAELERRMMRLEARLGSHGRRDADQEDTG